MGLYKLSAPGTFKDSRVTYKSLLMGNPAVVNDKGSMYPIATFTLASGVTNVEFTSIPQAYTHLQLRCTFLGDTATGYDVTMQFNGDTGSNYRWHRLYGNGTSGLAQGAASATTGLYVAADAARTTFPVAAIIDIFDYKSTNKSKIIVFNIFRIQVIVHAFE